MSGGQTLGSLAVHATRVEQNANADAVDRGRAPAAPPARVGNFNPADLAKLSPEARRQFTEQLTRAGHDPGAVAAALLAGAAPPAGQPINTGPVARSGDLSPQQSEQAAETLTKHWTGDPAVLRTALENAGLVEADTEDGRSEAARAFDAAHGGLDPSGYSINGAFVGTNLDAPTALQMSDEMRSAFSALGLSATVAPGVAAELARNASDAPALFEKFGGDWQSPKARTWWQGEQAKVAKALDMPYSQAIELAKTAVNRIDRKVAESLARRGCFESGNAIVRLAQAEQARQARAKL